MVAETTPSSLETASTSQVPSNSGNTVVPISSRSQLATTTQPSSLLRTFAEDAVVDSPVAPAPQFPGAPATLATSAPATLATSASQSNTLGANIQSTTISPEIQTSDALATSSSVIGSLKSISSSSPPSESIAPSSGARPSSPQKVETSNIVATIKQSPETSPLMSGVESNAEKAISRSINVVLSEPSAIIDSEKSVANFTISDVANSDLNIDGDEGFHQSVINLTRSFGPARDTASRSANILIVTAVTTNIASAVISIATSSTAAISSATTGMAATQGCWNTIDGGVIRANWGHEAPVVDFTDFFMLINYLQFVSSTSHLSLPTAPDFFFQFTDALGWCNLQPTSAHESSKNNEEKGSLVSENISNFTVADGDIISGILAYAERINIQPEELFPKTAIVFGSIVGGVAAVVATLYSLLRLVLREQYELIVQRLDDLPRARLLMRLLIQSCLSVCLLSEYALSMTSSFQMRYNEQDQQHNSSSAFAFATVELIFVCCGLIVLGVVKIRNKSEDDLLNPDFKFAWGAYYKYYHYEQRYFFVAKMGAEILSGIIIGLVSDVPSQLTLLMALQLAMFLYTVECAPYTMDFQSVCSSIAFVMKMVTYALISSFLTPATDVTLQDFIGTLVIMLQLTLLVLHNSRQLYVLYKQTTYLWEIRQKRLLHRLEMKDKNHAVLA
ncbi:putative transient receptor potential channel Flc/Pkd2 [Plasmopara halstedii]